jgi:hypothetical protein
MRLNERGAIAGGKANKAVEPLPQDAHGAGKGALSCFRLFSLCCMGRARDVTGQCVAVNRAYDSSLKIQALMFPLSLSLRRKRLV